MSSPPSVTPVLVDAATLREKIHAKAVHALQDALKLNLNGRTLSVEDIQVSRREFSPEEQKRALLRGDSLRTPVKGTLVLKDAEGKVIDKSVNHTLVHLPYLTERHTVIADGNEYQFANQLRRKPGVYTQRSDNGELKTVFNLGRGANFDLGFNADKGTFSVQYGTTNVPLYAMLRGLGVPHDAIAMALGPGLASANEAAQGRQVDSAIDKLYDKLVPPTMRPPGATRDQKVELIKKRYAVTTLDPEVTQHTLGHPHSTVTPHALLDAAKRLVGVHKGHQSVDDTDSLAFKTFHAVDDFLAERIRLGAREWSMKARRALNGKTDIKSAIRPAPLTPSIHKFITTSSLTAVPSGINPLELIDHAVKVTALGEGGIPSDRAIPYDARMTHNTHFGAIDPVRTPECFVGDTEVLTEGGWKKWADVTESDVFACRIEGRLEFHKASRLIKEKYTGILYGVRSPKLEYLVTPNHKVLCAPIDRVYPLDNNAAQKLRLVRADDTHGKPRVFDTAHDAYVGHDEPYQIPKLPGYENNVGPIEMPVWASFMGWYLSEGSISRQANGEAARVVISQVRAANPVKCEMIEAVLRRLPFKWSSNAHLFMVCHRQLAAYLEQFGFCDTKFIPDYFFSASIEARENLLEALMLGDGRSNSKRATGKTYRQQVYTTTSRQLALDVERIAISLGRSVRVSKYEDRREERYLDVYEVRLLCDRFRQAVPRKRHYYTTEHDGYVYCATVPGSLLYVRHGEGLGHWSGNSGHSGVDVRASLLAHRDDKGNLYTVVHDVKTGKDAFLKAGDLSKYVVAFANQPLKGQVMAFVNGEVQPVSAARVTHQMYHVSHQFSPATSLIPMIHNIQGNRAIMGSKMGTQALPLIAREAPYVQVQADNGKGISYETVYGHMVVPVSPVKGTVEKIDGGYVYVRPHGTVKKAAVLDLGEILSASLRAAEDPDAPAFEKEAASDAGLVKVPYQQHFPFPSKTFLHHTLAVKPGDKVEEGQRLGDSNYTREGTLALGKNLSVAYIPYHGLNSNDAVVISQSAAKKLTSEHMYREVYPLNSRITLSKPKHRAYYGNKYTPQQYNKLDDAGVIKVGAKVDPKDPLVLGLVKTELQGTDLMLGRISKSLVKPFKEVTLQWEHGTPGVVSEVVRTATQIAILVKTEEQMQIGDKLCYDAETDVLTSKGWKPIADVTVNDQVATLHAGTTLVFEQPSATYRYAQGGRMYKIRNQQVDLFVTENHRMWVAPRGGDYGIYTAKDIYGKRVRYQKNAHWAGTDADVVLPSLQVKAGQSGRGTRELPAMTIPARAYAMLLGAYVSEGSLVDQPGTYGIDITQIKVRQRSELLRALEEYGFKYTEHSNGTKVRIHSKQLMEHFKPLGKSYEKYLPEFVFDWSAPTLRLLFDWLMWGDGHTSETGLPSSYTTTSKRLADDVQRLCLHIGLAANIKSRHTPKQTIKGKVYACRECYAVRIVNTKVRPEVNHGHTRAQHAQEECWINDYRGPVYCLTVPSGVIYVRRNGKGVWSGNCGRFGNKGVVAHIVPDHEMLHDEAGKPIDLLLSSAGVISRINPAQVIETAIGKVAEKTGKPIVYDNAAQHDALQWAKDLMAKHGVKDKETIYDPVTKRYIKGPDGKGVLVGRQYIYKLFKSTDTNFAGHGVGPYDGNEQPLKTGGDDSAKGIGKMELDALIAHNARNILQENATVKSQKNDEFWKAIQLGTPLPTPKPSFAFNKFRAMLEGAGVKVDKRDSKFKLLPLTDRDVLNKSKGEIENKKTLTAKTLRPEKGGLFDVHATGGPQGTLYSHISLHEPIPNPVFEEPVRRLLGLTQKQFDQHVQEKGGAWFKEELAKINVDAKLTELNAALRRASGPELDNIVKQIKYLTALKAENLKPHEAYVLSKIPVIPPQFRPVLPDIRNPAEVSIGDANKLYGHLLDANAVLKNTALPSDLPKHRGLVFNAVGAVFGTHVAQDEKLQKQEVKGFLSNIAGVGTPKGGFFQRKLMRRTQDVSGRGTAVPDPNLGMDEVGIPELMLWQMLDKLIVARLVRQGYSALDARAQVDKKTPVAREALIAETKERPVLINRAPTLHRWSIIAAYPRLVKGKTIRVSPFIEKGMNLDFDGDTLQVHAPIQPGAIADAKRMTLSQLLMSDQQRDKILAFPQHEAVIGVALASEAKPSTGPVKKFNTREDALRAWRSGQLQLSDQIEILNEKRAGDESDEEGPLTVYAGLTSEEALSFWPAENVTGHGAIDDDPDGYSGY